MNQSALFMTGPGGLRTGTMDDPAMTAEWTREAIEILHAQRVPKTHIVSWLADALLLTNEDAESILTAFNPLV